MCGMIAGGFFFFTKLYSEIQPVYVTMIWGRREGGKAGKKVKDFQTWMLNSRYLNLYFLYKLF